MRKIWIALLPVLAIVLAPSAFAQSCTGQFPSGNICGVAGASQAPAGSSTVTSILDRNFGAPSAQGTILNRGASLWGATVSPVLGNPNSTQGSLGFAGASGGTATLRALTTAGTPTLLLPNTSGTLAAGASSPLVLDASTGNLTCPTCVTGTGGDLTATPPLLITGTDISIVGAAGQILGGATPAFTATPTLGVAGTTLGSIGFQNLTSGTITLQPATGALGTSVLSLPIATDTLVGKATTDTFTNKTLDTAATGNSLLINGLAVTANTGTGAVVRETSPSIATPTITGALTYGGVTLSSSVTGTGSMVLATNPSIASPTFTGTVAGPNTIPLGVIAQSAANTMLGNWTGSTANVAANAMPSCPDSGGNHLNYVSGTGITCGTGIGNGITALTGDVTATGPGTVAATLATVNSNVGSFGSATQAPQFTVNAKGLVTAAANVTVTPAIGSVTGLGTGVATALGVNVGSAGAPVVNGGALGTPSSGVATNLTGTASGLTAGTVTTNANLTGPITSTGNATSVASQTGTGSTFVMSTSPTITTPSFGTGFTIGGSATSGNYARGNGTNFVSSAIQIGDLPSPFTNGTRSGNTSSFATTSGTLTSGDCVQIDASGNFVAAGAACGSGSGGSITPYNINGTCYVDGTTYATIYDAIAACTSNVTIVVPSNQTITSSLSSPTLSGVNVHVKCVNGATLTYDAGRSFQFTGAGSGMDDCILAGPGIGTNTISPLYLRGDNQYARNNRISGFEIASGAGILIGSGNHIKIQSNNVSNMKGWGIAISTLASTTVEDVQITTNTVENGIWSAMGSGAVLRDILIDDNTLTVGNNISTLSCVQLITNTGTTSDVTVTNNKCRQTGNLTTGGGEPYAFGAVANLTFNNNTFNYNGYTMEAYAAEFNLSGSPNLVANGNNFNCGTTAVSCFQIFNPSNFSLQGNVLNGSATSTSSSILSVVGNSGTSGDGTITGGTLAFPSGGANTGVTLQANGSGVTLRNISVNGVKVRSGGTALSVGLYGQIVSSGALDGISFTMNMINSPATGAKVDNGTTHFCYSGAINTGATPTSFGTVTPACN